MDKIWSDGAWEDYLYWQTQDKKTLRRINQQGFLYAKAWVMLFNLAERDGQICFRMG